MLFDSVAGAVLCSAFLEATLCVCGLTCDLIRGAVERDRATQVLCPDVYSHTSVKV